MVLHMSVHAQWTLLPVEGPGSSPQIWFSDPAHGYYSGADTVYFESWDGGMIMETFDGGISWDTIFDPEGGENFPFKVMFSGEIGYTSNRHSNFYRTSNGGADWELIEFDGTDFLYSGLQMPDANTVLISGYSGEIFKITDFGETIVKTLDLGTPYYVLYNLQCVGEDTCYVHTNYDIYRSIDRGDTWTKIYSTPENWVRALFVYPNHELMMAHYNEDNGLELMHSESAGAAWDTVSIINPESGHLAKIVFIDSIGYCIGYDYMLKQTTDSGKHWVDIVLDTLPGASGSLHDIQLLDAHTGFIAGYDGLFYSMGVPTEIDQPEMESTIIVYPNPATEFISIGIPETADISILSVMGELIYHNTHDRNARIDVQSWKKGIYFIRSGMHRGVFVVV